MRCGGWLITYGTKMKQGRLHYIILIAVLGFFVGIQATQAQYKLLHVFAGWPTDGSEPHDSLTLFGTTLYGMTLHGGSINYGTVFQINSNGAGYTNLHSFANGVGEGDAPYGSLTLSGSTLYGMTAYGYDGSMVFQINSNGAGYTNLHSFANGEGSTPYGSLTLSGSSLYGMTYSGGSNYYGTVFKMNSNGTGYTNLHSFVGGSSDGQYPYGNLTLSGATLYGMTRDGGSNNDGTVFQINTNGTGFMILHHFAGGNGDGRWPYGSLTLSGSTLYGMTAYGGSNDNGTVFKINANGTGYTNLHSFAISEGQTPNGSLTLLGVTLYGMTLQGGGFGYGTVFQIKTNGAGFTILHKFTGGNGDGSHPRGSLTLSGYTLFGMTGEGGSNNCGVVFALPLPLNISITPSTTTFFGSLLVNSTTDRVFNVSNVSTSTISGTVSVPLPFSVVSGGNFTLAQGQSTNTTIRYAPVVSGNDTAYATFTDAGGSQTRQVIGSAYTNPTVTTGSITGRVTRVSDGTPVNTVVISVVGSDGTSYPQALSRVNGDFSISGIRPNAHYSVAAMPPNPLLLNTLTKSNVTVVVGQTTTVNIVLPSTTSGKQPPTLTPTNIPVVLVRGFGKDDDWATDDSNSWSEIRSALVANGFTNVWDCNQPEPGIMGGTGHVINGQFGIDDNAGQLKLYVQQKALQYQTNHNGYYPPQIHIVAHSMGGLITRGALQNYDQRMFPSSSCSLKVGKVVMLGTPNCGSKVADYGFQPGVGGLLLDILSMRWTSTSNLQTFAMTGHYNPSHPWPSVPLYLCSAGNSAYVIGKLWPPTAWNGGWDLCPLGEVAIGDMNKLNGTGSTDERINDGVVTKPSVNGVYWTRVHWTYDECLPPFQPPYPVTSVALNPVQSITDTDLGKSLDHFFLMKDSSVADWIVKTLLNPNPTPTLPLTASLTSVQGVETLDAGGVVQSTSPLQTFELVSGTMTNGVTVALPIASDANTTMTFQLMASDTNIIFRLNNPCGGIINANTPQTNSNVQYTASVVASNLLVATFTIVSPTAGVWTAIVDASSITSAQAAYSLTVFGDSDVGLIPQTASLFAPGQDAVLSCGLADISNNPVVAVSNASITATVQFPDGTTNSLTLFDDGWHNDGSPNDGVYSTVLTDVQLAGTYSITYRANGTNAQGRALQRVVTGTFSVSSGNGSVLGVPFYENEDTDGDGYADFIIVKVWVNPTVSGKYILAGDLVDAIGTNRVSQSAEFGADGTGPMQVTLIFSLTKIRAVGGSGDFHIENLQLFEVSGIGTAWLDAYRGSSIHTLPAANPLRVWLATYNLPSDGSVDYVDSDGDGMNNWQEYLAGTDPTNSNSVFRVTSGATVSGEGFILRWPSISNRFYDLSRATNLLMGTNSFSILPSASNMPTTPTVNSYTDAVQGVGPYFYRIDVRQ